MKIALHAMGLVGLLVLQSFVATTAFGAELYFVWNGNPAEVQDLGDDAQWNAFGNRHEAQCDYDLEKAAADAGSSVVTLRSGRQMVVRNMTKDHALAFWITCMRSKGWEHYGSHSDVVARRSALRAADVRTIALVFTKNY